MRRIPKQHNPVAKALALPMNKHRIVPARNKHEKRAKDKLRQSLREYCRLYLVHESVTDQSSKRGRYG